MIFNEISDRGQLTQILQRRLNMLGAAPAPALMPEIAPTLTLEHDRPEWGWLKGELPRSRTINVTGVAAQFSHIQLYIPTNRRNIAVITSIISNQATIAQVGRSFIGGGLVGWVGGTSAGRDLRDNSNGGAVLIETTTNISLPGGFLELARISGITAQYDQPIILAPTGQALFIHSGNVNQTLTVTVSWYEREAFPGELG